MGESHAFKCSLKTPSDLGADIVDELNRLPINCNSKSIHLTFDDGPSSLTTPLILEELKKRQVKATFFITTTNLDKSNKHALEARALVMQEMKDGHLIGSHGHIHESYDLRANAKGEVLSTGLTQSEREHQIDMSHNLLNEATEGQFSKQPYSLFRLPYGRGAMPSEIELKKMSETHMMKFQSNNFAGQLKEYRDQSPTLQTLAYKNFSHLGWNHDSKDSSFGAGEIKSSEVKRFIKENLKTLCEGHYSPKVALFHDIKKMNITSIPLIIDIGRCLGLKFISPGEMMKEKEALIASHVLIDKNQTKKGPVDQLTKILGQLNEHPLNCDDANEDNTCYSQQLKRRFAHCEGQESICYQGKWHSKNDPVVIENCP